MTTMTRPARPEDLTAALDVWRRANTARGKTPSPERIARVRAKLADPAAVVVVAECAGELVGMALAEQGRDRDAAGEILPELCHISVVFVRPDHWGNRIGQLLLDALGEQAGQGHTLLQLCTGEGNQRALRLYDRAGFRPSGRTGLLDTGERIIHPHSVAAADSKGRRNCTGASSAGQRTSLKQHTRFVSYSMTHKPARQHRKTI